MSSGVIRRGRGQATLSVVIGVVGILFWLLATRTQLLAHASIPDAVLIAGFLGGGLVGAAAGILALFRGRGRTRLAAIAGLLMDLLLIVLGLIVFEFTLNPIQIPIFGSG